MTAIIQSIQPFTITGSTVSTGPTAAISAVNTSNSFIIPNGVSGANTLGSKFGSCAYELVLTSSVLVTANRAQASTVVMTIAGTVIEFANFVGSVQSGSISVTTATTGGTAAINAVSTRAFVIYQGSKYANAASSYGGVMAGVKLVNSTQVSVTVAPSSAETSVRYTVVDLTSDLVETVEQIDLATSVTASTADVATIAAVDVGRTLIIDGGRASTGGITGAQSSQPVIGYYPSLAGATSVVFTRASSASGVLRRHFASVVQFKAQAFATTVQRGTISCTSASSVATSTIAAVTTLGFLNTALYPNHGTSASNPGGGLFTHTLASTLVTMTRGTTVHSWISAYEVVQWSTGFSTGAASTSVGSGLVYGNLLSGHVRSPVNRANYIIQESV
jgi:hypothetical protein